jgi:DNA polymerase-3 subunit epsilon
LGFDTETTGVRVEADRIVTTALVARAADGSVTERTWLIDPGVEIPPPAQAVHGITTEYAREHGAAPEVALEEIATALVAGLAAGVPVLAFNASYDLRIIEADLARHGLATLADRLGRPVAPVIDPLVIDRGVDRYRRGKRKLADLMSVYRVAPSDHLHDALEDVRQAIAVFDAMAGAYPELDAMDLAGLHAWQAAKHKEWAINFNDYLARQGKVGDVDPTWP